MDRLVDYITSDYSQDIFATQPSILTQLLQLNDAKARNMSLSEVRDFARNGVQCYACKLIFGGKNSIHGSCSSAHFSPNNRNCPRRPDQKERRDFMEKKTLLWNRIAGLNVFWSKAQILAALGTNIDNPQYTAGFIDGLIVAGRCIEANVIADAVFDEARPLIKYR